MLTCQYPKHLYVLLVPAYNASRNIGANPTSRHSKNNPHPNSHASDNRNEKSRDCTHSSKTKIWEDAKALRWHHQLRTINGKGNVRYYMHCLPFQDEDRVSHRPADRGPRRARQKPKRDSRRREQIPPVIRFQPPSAFVNLQKTY